MSVPEPMAVHPQAQAGAGMTREAAMGAPAEARPGQATCGACGQPWFGDVAYCPYCGRPSAGAAADTAADASAAPAPQAALPPVLEQEPGSAARASAAVARVTHAVADRVHSFAGQMRASAAMAGAWADRPGIGWRVWWKPVATVAALGVVAIAVDRLSTRSGDAAAAQETTRTTVAAPGPAPATPAVNAVPAPPPTTTAMGAPPAPVRGEPAGSAQPPPTEPAAAPRADTQPQAPAPPAPRRSLCSAASEAAGLCNPQ